MSEAAAISGSDPSWPSGAARLAGVVGDPVAHSLSPLLMREWLRGSGIDGQYAAFHVTPSHFSPFVEGISRSASLAGLNVTLPHKQAALAVAGEASPAARAIGAANLLTFRDGRIEADNTDAAGFMAALDPAGIDYSRSTALILGAGGAARALLYALAEAGIARVLLTNRSPDKAEALARDLAPSANIIDWAERHSAAREADLVINATSLGLGGDTDLVMDWQEMRPGAVAFDSVYTPLETGFLAGARAAGLVAIDGLDMLIGQARPSFRAFFGAEAPGESMAPVRPRLESALGGRP